MGEELVQVSKVNLAIFLEWCAWWLQTRDAQKRLAGIKRGVSISDSKLFSFHVLTQGQRAAASEPCACGVLYNRLINAPFTSPCKHCLFQFAGKMVI